MRHRNGITTGLEANKFVTKSSKSVKFGILHSYEELYSTLVLKIIDIGRLFQMR